MINIGIDKPIEFYYMCPKCFDHIKCTIPAIFMNCELKKKTGEFIDPNLFKTPLDDDNQRRFSIFTDQLSRGIKPICEHDGETMFHCDKSIAHIIYGLNKDAKLYTKYCCEGHDTFDRPYIMFDPERISSDDKRFIRDFINEYKYFHVYEDEFINYINYEERRYLNSKEHEWITTCTVYIDMSDLYDGKDDELMNKIFKEGKKSFIKFFEDLLYKRTAIRYTPFD